MLENALKIGLTARQGAIAGAMVNLGMAIGRPLVGYLSDHVGRINMITASTFLSGLFHLCIPTSAQTSAMLLAFSVLGGTVCGAYLAVSSRVHAHRTQQLTRLQTIGSLLTDVLGFKLLLAALSIVRTSIVFPGTFAEPVAL